MKQRKVCPICQREYTGYPAISRVDNKTQICSDCGVREAMAYMGVDPGETERVLDVIHQQTDAVKD